MSALREFLKTDYMEKLKSNGHKGPDAPTVKDAAVSTKSTVAVEKRADAAVLQAQIKSRLAKVAGPYKEAVAKNGPDAQELKELYGVFKTSADKGEYTDAAEALGSLEELLDERKNPPAGLDGMDTGQAQAFPGQTIVEKGIEKGIGKLTESRKITIIIKNESDKVLEYMGDDLKHKGSAEWEKGPPEKIAAKTGVAKLIVKTKKGILDRNKLEGLLSYVIVGSNNKIAQKDTQVAMKWVKKEQPPLQILIPQHEDRFEIKGHNHKDGTFTFTLRNKGEDKKDPKQDTKPPESPAPAQPKIRPDTIVVGSFAFGDDTVAKITPIGDMLDYNKLSAWYKNLPDATRIKIINGQPPGGKKIVLTGFTDNVGSEHNNLELGRKRAVAVAEALQKISGVAWSDFIATPSNGEQEVREENKNLEKKEPKHRRVKVEIHIEE